MNTFYKASQFLSAAVLIISILMCLTFYNSPTIFYPWCVTAIISFLSFLNLLFIANSISFFSKIFYKQVKIIIKLSRLTQWILTKYEEKFDSKKDTRQQFIQELYLKIKELDEELKENLDNINSRRRR